jgi:hypothetical protein
MKIDYLSREPLEMARGDRDVFFDLIGEDLGSVRDEYETKDGKVIKVSGVFAAAMCDGDLIPGFPIDVDLSTTPRPNQITVYANPSQGIPDGLTKKELWVVIVKDLNIVAERKGLFLTA